MGTVPHKMVGLERMSHLRVFDVHIWLDIHRPNFQGFVIACVFLDYVEFL